MNSCEIKNIIDREEFLQRVDIRIRAMSALITSHEKYIISFSLGGEKKEKAMRQIEKANIEFLEQIAKIDNDTRERFDKVRQEYNVSEETE